MRDITRNDRSSIRYTQGATRKGTGVLDLDNPEIMKGRRYSRSVAYHAPDILIQGKRKDQWPSFTQ
jgi:hypothetical protein